MKRPFLFISFIIAIVVSLSIVQVVVSNSISTTGIELGKLQTEIAKYEKHNALLSEQILTVSSLTYIEEVAKEDGFVLSKSHIFLPTSLPLAKR